MSVQPTAIITGAGSGIGRATTARLSSLGYSVVLAGRGEAALRAVAEGLGAGARALVVPTDMGVEGEADRLVDRAVERFGRIDVLVNNAGFGRLLPIGQTSGALVRECMEVNAIGPALAVLRAWPTFVRQGSGCVVNVSSLSTIDPFAGFLAYAASKAAMNLMADSIAKEGAAVGVSAYCVAPGAVETPLLRMNFDEKMIPGETCLKPEDVAAVIAECVEGRRRADNGRTIGVMRDAAGVRVWTIPRASLAR
ncbi:MAG: SDR family oxidoreductase [Phycisphaerae bacterium]|nr:SDR family oxidoreductase [Phycisphaerae bacterium]